MADSSTRSSSTRQSSRIAKRLKATPSGSTLDNSSVTGSNVDAAAAKKPSKRTTTTTATTSRSTKGKKDAKQPPTLLRSTGTSEGNLSPLEDDKVLQEIFSYVGDFQYLFIGSINRSFEKSYATAFPKKMTHFNATTIDHTKFCWDEICKCKDDKKKDKNKRGLYHSAAQYGKIDVVKYLLELLPPASKNISFKKVPRHERLKMDWMYDLCYTAAKYGQMELLQWAYDENICVSKDDDTICHSAITHGHIDIFQWAIKNGFPFEQHDLAAYDACRNGQLEALKFLIDKEYDFEVGGGNRGESCGCCNSAAEKGQLDILIWLHENYEPNCDGHTLENAISSGHVPTVKYLLDNKRRWHSLDETYNLAAFVGSLTMIQSLRSLDIAWDEDAIIEKAAQGGHLEIIKWISENGCPLTKSACEYASGFGHLETLKGLRAMDCPWNEDTIVDNAAEGGHLDIIKWAIENGCSLREDACQYAAGFGHLETLKGLRALGCPWGEDTTTYALTDEICTWAKMNGCPVAKGNPREKL